VTGCVVQQTTDAPDPDTVKDIVEIVDREAFLPPGVVSFASGWRITTCPASAMRSPSLCRRARVRGLVVQDAASRGR
jgi:hypothetical protein